MFTRVLCSDILPGHMLRAARARDTFRIVRFAWIMETFVALSAGPRVFALPIAAFKVAPADAAQTAAPANSGAGSQPTPGSGQTPTPTAGEFCNASCTEGQPCRVVFGAPPPIDGVCNPAAGCICSAKEGPPTATPTAGQTPSPTAGEFCNASCTQGQPCRTLYMGDGVCIPALGCICFANEGPPTATPTLGTPATATPTPNAPGCVGDCNGDGSVSIDEIVLMVNILLGVADRSACVAGDANQDGVISVEEVLQAVNRALEGCIT